MKRFTDTNIWDEDWFLDLPNKYKLFWFYIVNKSDMSGVWRPNKGVISRITGERLCVEEFLSLVNTDKERLRVLPNGRWFLPSFFAFQYSTKFVISSPVHRGVLKQLVSNDLHICDISNIETCILHNADFQLLKEIAYAKDKDSLSQALKKIEGQSTKKIGKKDVETSKSQMTGNEEVSQIPYQYPIDTLSIPYQYDINSAKDKDNIVITTDSNRTIVQSLCCCYTHEDKMRKDAAAAMRRFKKDLPDKLIESLTDDLVSKFLGKEISDFQSLCNSFVKNMRTKDASRGNGDTIEIDGVEHKAKRNGKGWVYPTIVGEQFSDDFSKVKLIDGNWRKLSTMDTNLARKGNIHPSDFYRDDKLILKTN